MGRDVELELVEGPAWANQGFSIEADPGQRTRLRTYVPFVHSSLEEGSGETLTQVIFDVISSGPTEDAPAPRHSLRTSDRPTAEHRAPWRIGRVSDAARPILERTRTRRYDPWARGLLQLRISVRNPGSEVLEDTHCRISAIRGEDPQCKVTELPPRLAFHRTEVEDAFRFLYDFVVNDPLGFLLSGEYTVDLERREEREAVLRFVPTGEDEGEEEAYLVVSDDGRIVRLHRRRFGVEGATHFEWRTLPEGDILSRLTTENVRYGQPHVIDVKYDDPTEGLRLPSCITVQVPGLLAHPFDFRPHYEQVERAGR